MISLTLSILPERFALCRLDLDAPIPDWAVTGNFSSVTRTSEELSITCPENQVPEGVKCVRGWKCLKVRGPLDFADVGHLASLAGPLAKAGISILVTATYDTDYLMVQEKNLEKAIEVLSRAGHKGPWTL